MNQEGVLRRDFNSVVIDYRPIRFVVPLFEGQVGNPARPFAQVALAPIMIVAGLQTNFGLE